MESSLARDNDVPMSDAYRKRMWKVKKILPYVTIFWSTGVSFNRTGIVPKIIEIKYEVRNDTKALNLDMTGEMIVGWSISRI